MIIQKKRIRNLTQYIDHITDDSPIIIGVSNPVRFSSMLTRLGFQDPAAGQVLLPASVGPITTYNAEGKWLKQKNLPKETAYRQIEWSWTEWHGHDRILRTEIKDVPYERYPRLFMEPPSVELTISQNPARELLLIGPSLKKNDANLKILTHIVNIFLEAFGECEFFSEGLDAFTKAPTRRLNWDLLPRGEMPWLQMKKIIEPIVQGAPEGNQTVIYYRLQCVNKLKPDFRAIGHAGFHGYIVHGFTANNIYILESMYYGNATYVFGETWEELSKKTKAEILNEKLQMARIIHRDGWESNIQKIITGGSKKENV